MVAEEATGFEAGRARRRVGGWAGGWAGGWEMDSFYLFVDLNG